MAELFIRAFVAHCIVEYMFQPIWVAGVKRDWWRPRPLTAVVIGLLHTLTWTAAVTAAQGGSLSWVQMFVLASVHYAIDCSPLGGWLFGLVGIPTVSKALDVIEQHELKRDMSALELSLGAAHESLAYFAAHITLIAVVLL